MVITATGDTVPRLVAPFFLLPPPLAPGKKRKCTQSSESLSLNPSTTSSMLQHHRPPALMPLGEQDAAASALVLHVFEAGDEVGHATEAGEHARQSGPETV